MTNIFAVVEMTPSIASVVITGLVIVFAMLLFFVLLFGGFGKLMSAVSNARKDDTVKPAPKKIAPAPNAVPTKSVSSDDELIAVISAAVYAMYEGSGKKPVIRSIRPAARNGKSAWAMAGIYNNIKSF